ncbi:hypothetical protein VTN02DRAFT_6658 [Thermoascus thermophilus]
MARRCGSSVASAVANSPPDSDQHSHDRPEDAMGVDFSEQLLTPENSRSETSSNNDHALGEDKTVLPHTSRRVTRSSLRGIGNLDNPNSQPDTIESSPDLKSHTVSGGTLVDNVAECNNTSWSSLLRHSVAVMETSSWSHTADGMKTDSPAVPRDTPVSKDFQEPQQADSRGSLRQRTLRERPLKAVAREKEDSAAAEPVKADNGRTVRRSSRLSLMRKATDLAEKAGSVLGQRPKDVTENGKELGRRIGLRPRSAILPKKRSEMGQAAVEAPAAKKSRVSENDSTSKSIFTSSSGRESLHAPNPVPRYKPKRWLSHGLYIGQDRYMDPRLNEAKNKIKSAGRKSSGESQRKLLPMPMFAGERLLKNGRDFKLPFDIFSPLPPGQPKPDEWRKTNKNVFVGEAASIWKANKHTELSTCMCTEETGCDENCQNRYMFYECDDGNCRLGAKCGNRSFHELKQRTKAGGKYNIGVEVIKTMDRGYGVRSNRTFEPNQIIVEYTGEIITQAECESRMRTIYKNNECYYLMYFDQNMIIDATRGSIARFVNHSCEPNCRMEKWTVAGKPRMALFAGDRGIMTGEELTYDYNFDPFSQKNVQECRCGAPTCRGVLGPKPRDQRPKEPKVEDKDKRKSQLGKREKVLTGTKRKVEHVLDESTSRLNKKQKLSNPKSLRVGIKRKTAAANVEAKTIPTKATKTRTPPKIKEKPKKRPKAKGSSVKSETKAAIRRPKSKATCSRSTAISAAPFSTKSNSKLNRPSAKTKAKISGSSRGATATKRLTDKGKTNSSKGAGKIGVKDSERSDVKAQSRRENVRSMAKNVVCNVKEQKGW